MFRNTLTANHKYSFQDLENLLSPTQLQLFLKLKTLFLIFPINFWKLDQLLKILKKKIIVLATLLWKLQAVKELVRPLPKNQRVRTPFDSEHVNGSRTLVKSA